MNNTPAKRRGVALLLVLGLLVLSATVAAAVSRRSLRESAEARDAVDRLQASWLALSAERVLLPKAETLLRGAESDRRAPVAVLVARVELDEKVVELELSDDTTRVSPFAMASRVGLFTYDQIVRDALPTALAPHFETDRVLGYLFGNSRTAFYSDIFAPEAGAVDGVDALLTPHGDGQINLLRADEDALRLALVPPLSKVEVQDLLRARRDLFDSVDDFGRDRILLQMLREAGVSINVGGDLQLWTAESTRHRLKTTITDGRRTFRRVRVVDTDENRPLDLIRKPSAGELP